MSTEYRLHDLAAILRGRVPANTVPEASGPRFFGLAEITARGHAEPRYVPQDADLEGAIELQKGDLVVALMGNIGDAALIDTSSAGSILGRECAAIRVKVTALVRPAWLCAWMISEECKSQVATETTGTTMPRLSPSAVEKFTVTVPVMQKQHDVEDLVQKFDAAIATTATTLQHLQELRAAELQLAFTASEETP